MIFEGMILPRSHLSIWSTSDSGNMPNHLCTRAFSTGTCKALHSYMDDRWIHMKTESRLALHCCCGSNHHRPPRHRLAR